MNDKEFDIEIIKTVDNLISFYNNINLEYGRIIMLRIYLNNNTYVEFKNKDDIQKRVSEVDLKNAIKISLSVYNEQKELYSVVVDPNTNKCKVQQISMDKKSIKKNPIRKLSEEEEQKLISDPLHGLWLLIKNMKL